MTSSATPIISTTTIAACADDVPNGKLYQVEKYNRSILRISESRWTGAGEDKTVRRKIVAIFYSDKENEKVEHQY